MNKKLHCIIAVADNCWGRGQTVRETLDNLVEAGAYASQSRPFLRAQKNARLRFIIGDNKAYVNGMGDLMIAEGAESFSISEK